MNKVIMMGRLTREPEISYSQSSTPLAIGKFSIAVDRKFKRPNDTVTADFFNCTTFGKQAEFVEKFLRKGTKVLITGRIQNDNYTNKEGQKVYSTQIMVDEIEFAESKASSDRNDNHDDMRFGAGEPTPAADGFMNVEDSTDSELPF